MRSPGGHLTFINDAKLAPRRGLGGVVLLVEERYRAQLQPAGLVAALSQRNVGVILAEPNTLVVDDTPSSWLDGAGLVVARGRSAPLLTGLRAAEGLGLRTLNRSTAVEAVRNKASMACALVAAGIPTPPAWVGRPAELASTIPTRCYPLVLKPVFGDNARGIRLVGDASELASLVWPEALALAQPFVPNEGDDLKVYAVGDRFWAVRAPSPVNLTGVARPARPPQGVPLTTELAELGRACGELFGLELYGVDCLMTPEGPVVIEVNDFPNYRGVAEADEALADHVISCGGQS